MCFCYVSLCSAQPAYAWPETPKNYQFLIAYTDVLIGPKHFIQTLYDLTLSDEKKDRGSFDSFNLRLISTQPREGYKFCS